MTSVSTATLRWMPMARVMTLRFSAVATSALVIRPRLSCSWTMVWSSVSWCARSLRKRYARLSPTCAMTALRPQASSATSVVPMPRLPGSPSESAYTSAHALWTARSIACAALSRASSDGARANASSTAFSPVRASRSDFTAAALATSPAACPPMPSATA